jgi:NADP oxidoreductase coenzyme F420-dependent
VLRQSSVDATNDGDEEEEEEPERQNRNSNERGDGGIRRSNKIPRNNNASFLGSQNGNISNNNVVGKLELLKQRESRLAAQLAAVRREKLATLRSRPLRVGIVGFGRFGQFLAKTFVKHCGEVVVTSRSDYGGIATAMGARYVPLSDPAAFLAADLDVIVVAVSILSFEATLRELVPHLKTQIEKQRSMALLPSLSDDDDDDGDDGSGDQLGAATPRFLHGPLIVDVLSVKEHARKLMLELLPSECDILCTHPMFGPDSGKDGWYDLNFVYEKTRIDNVLLAEPKSSSASALNVRTDSFKDAMGSVHSVHEDSEAHVEGVDRMGTFLVHLGGGGVSDGGTVVSRS